jgi:transcriptional regulator GlxA family with amidase domain
MEWAAGSPKLLALLGSGVSEEVFDYYQRLGRVRRFVLDHYAEPITLADAASAAGMERTSFSTFFRSKTGVCFRDWLAAIRVMKAMELMAERNRPIRDVGLKAGFANVRTFERVFLRVTGQPPIEYKMSVRPH